VPEPGPTTIHPSRSVPPTTAAAAVQVRRSRRAVPLAGNKPDPAGYCGTPKRYAVPRIATSTPTARFRSAMHSRANHHVTVTRRVSRWARATTALVLPLTVALAVTGPAGARVDERPPRQAAVSDAAADGEDYNSYLRRTLFPELHPGNCLTGFVYLRGNPGWKVPIPACGALTYTELPQISEGQAAKLRTQPATKLAERAATVLAISLAEAKTELADAAGVPVKQLASLDGQAVAELVHDQTLAGLGGVRTKGSLAEDEVCADGATCRRVSLRAGTILRSINQPLRNLIGPLLPR
jgi:hypothetical protein